MKKSQIRMPLWGPYSKKYMGLSRIVDDRAAEGARYDFVVHPTLWNSATPVPNVTVPSGYHLWSCDEDFRFYSYRYEQMWKDQIYADVSYTRLDEESYLMRCRFVNDTDLSQNCILNIFGHVVAFVKFCAAPCEFLRTKKNAGRSFVLHRGNEVNYSAAAKLPKISSGIFSSASPTSLLATWNVTARTVSSSRKAYSASTVSPGVYIRQ